MTGTTSKPDVRTLADLLGVAPWRELEEHVNDLRERIDSAVVASHKRRAQLRHEILNELPELRAQVRRPSDKVMEWARTLLSTGVVAAADGTLAAVPLLSGTKIQVGVVIVTNTGDSVRLVTRVFEHELVNEGDTAREFFENLRQVHGSSNLASRALMLFGERSLLLGQEADWRIIHGELVPYELRTGVGKPLENLPPVFDLVRRYVDDQQFFAVSEGPEDLEVLNAAIILEPGEFIEIRMLVDDLTLFLDGDVDAGVSRAGFNKLDRERFRSFIAEIGPEVAIVLVKASHRPYLIECHRDRVDEAVALFQADALWTRGLPDTGAAVSARGFPFHVDLADNVLLRAGLLARSNRRSTQQGCRLRSRTASDAAPASSRAIAMRSSTRSLAPATCSGRQGRTVRSSRVTLATCLSATAPSTPSLLARRISLLTTTTMFNGCLT